MPPQETPKLAPQPTPPQGEIEQANPREQLIEEVLSPYHIHYAEGIEGHAINPEAAEVNFDTLLVLTKMIRDRNTVHRESKKGSWDENPDFDWYFDKYQDLGITRVDFDQPSKVVKMWLRKVGPHNDLSNTHDDDPEINLGYDAADDLKTARDWLLAEANRPGAKKPDYGLIAEVNLELAEIGLNDDTGHQYLSEAAQYLDRHFKDQTESGEFDKAALTRMKLASVHVELARQRYLGTSLPVNNADEIQYANFEQQVESILDQLRTYFHQTLNQIQSQYQILSDDTPDSIEYKNKHLAQSCGRLFEVFDYLEVMDSLVETERLAIAKFRPGFYREESGTAHKIDNHPNIRQIERDGEIVQLENHGFNYNFDFVYFGLIENPTPGEGNYRSIYYQLKIDPANAPSQAAQKASTKFFAGKTFYFTQPSDLTDKVSYSGDDRKYLDDLIEFMSSHSNPAEVNG